MAAPDYCAADYFGPEPPAHVLRTHEDVTASSAEVVPLVARAWNAEPYAVELTVTSQGKSSNASR